MRRQPQPVAHPVRSTARFMAATPPLAYWGALVSCPRLPPNPEGRELALAPHQAQDPPLLGMSNARRAGHAAAAALARPRNTRSSDELRFVGRKSPTQRGCAAHIEEGARNIGSPGDETLAARDHHERRIAGELHPLMFLSPSMCLLPLHLQRRHSKEPERPPMKKSWSD
jgi:hypothetical protein